MSIVRRAEPADLPSVLEMLREAALPTDGVERHFGGFLVTEDGGAIVGAGGLELHPPHALLRSVVVVPAHRGRGVAGAICSRLEADARTAGLASIWLLTTTARGFFAKRGYEVVDRSAAPSLIAATGEFSSLCPASATLMRLVP